MCGMSRKNAIDIIKAERECVCRQGRIGECCREEMEMGCGACDLVMEDVDIIEAYNMAIEALQMPREWIPCSERLPKEQEQYYVSGGDKVWICDFLIFSNFKGGWCNNVSNPVVEAWMPLPEPYKRGEEK